MCGALFSVGVAPQALQRPDSTHLSWVTCISFPFLILAVIEYVKESPTADRHQRQRVTAGVAAALALTLVVAPLFTFRYYLLHTRVSAGNVQTPFPVSRDGRRFYLGDFGPYLASRDVIADLDAMSKPGERLLVGPSDLRRTWYSDAFFYYMFPELTPSTYFIEMDPGLANAAGFAVGVRGGLVGLGDPHRLLGWMARTEQLDGLRLRRTEPGACTRTSAWFAATRMVGALVPPVHDVRSAVTAALVPSATHRDSCRRQRAGARCGQWRQTALASRRVARSLRRRASTQVSDQVLRRRGSIARCSTPTP